METLQKALDIFISPTVAAILAVAGIALTILLAMYGHVITHFNRQRYKSYLEKKINLISHCVTLKKYNLHSSFITFECLLIIVTLIFASVLTIVTLMIWFADGSRNTFIALLSVATLAFTMRLFFTAISRFERCVAIMSSFIAPIQTYSEIENEIKSGKKSSFLETADKEELLAAIEEKRSEWLTENT